MSLEWIDDTAMVRLMARLPFARKVALAGLVSALGILVLIVQLLNGISGQIDNSRLERDGLAMFRPLRHLAEPIQTHRGLTAIWASSDHGEALESVLVAAIDKEARAIDRQFAQVESRLLQGVPALAKNAKWLEVTRDWKEIRTNWRGGDSTFLLSKHNKLLLDLSHVTTAVVDEHKLSLDPQVGTYYLAQLVTKDLPEALEQIDKIRSMGAGILAARKQSPEDRNFLVSLNTISWLAFPRIADVLRNKIIAAEPRLQVKLGPLANHFADIPERLDALSQFNVAAGKPAPLAFFAALTSQDPARMAALGLSLEDVKREAGRDVPLGLIAPSYEALDVMADTLDEELGHRIASLQRQRRISLLVSIGTLMLTMYLLYLVWASFPIRTLIAATRKVAGGDLETRLDEGRQDELGQLARAFNHMTAEVQHNRSHLEEIVATRTADLLESKRSLNETLVELALILENASLGICTVVRGTDGRLTLKRVNRTMERMLGYEPGELEGAHCERLYPDEAEHLALSAAYANVVLATRTYTGEHTLRRKDGQVLPVALSGSAINPENLSTGSIWLIEDITERKRMAAELLLAKEQAEASTLAKGEFLANMSHEIRTPMNAVIGMTHLALQTALDAKQRNYLEKVDAAAKGLLGIINDILDFSKIEAGKIAFEQIDFQLEDVLDNLADLSVIKAQDKGLELLFDIGTDVPTALVGDPLRLGQVLTNLVGNAIKFTEKGEVTVAIQCVASGANEVWLRFGVADTGPGLSEDQCGRLFKAFAQADTSTTRKYGGTGLGLTISKRLVEMMGGEIDVESTPGRGSTFYFSAKFGVQAKQREFRLTLAHLPGLRVLVVDDNASAREIFLAMLSALRFEATAVGDGFGALRELEKAQHEGLPYGLVLVDWNMPKIGGVETVQRIQANRHLLTTPMCMMVTAYSREELLKYAQEAQIQIDGVLVKPVSPSTLCDSVATIFGTDIRRRLRSQQTQADYQGAKEALCGSRVLLVEDNEMNREVALELLGTAGVRVDIACNGAEAIEKVHRTDYDLILMDCQMPVLDGYEATRRIRADRRLGRLPVIAMTANAMTGDRERCLECGMNDHVAKPIDVGGLFSTLARWLKPRPTGDAELRREVRPQQAAMPHIAGLDTEAALARIGGNVEMLRKALGLFRGGQADTCGKIRQALGDGDRESAARLLHTLKGLAGTIGADEVFKTTEQLEHALSLDPTQDAELLLGNLERQMALLGEEIDRVAPRQSAADDPVQARGALESDGLARSLRALFLLLADADSEATTRVEAIAAMLTGSIVEEDFRRFAALTERHAFDEALELLQEIAGKLEIQLD